MNTALVSVIVPIHNGAKWLAQTLDSIFTQTHQQFEIILIDDASTDNLVEVLTPYRDDRLQVVRLEKNVGVSAARNRGIELARGDFIAFCDADDLCLPRRFELQLAFLTQHPDVGLCGSAFTCFDTQDRETVINPATDEEIKRSLMQGNCFGLPTVMGRASVFKVTRFDEGLNVAEDYDLWTRLAGLGVCLANLPQSLLRYRWHPQQASRHKSDKLDQTTRKIRGIYCAALLGDQKLLARLRSGSLEFDDLAEAAQLLTAHTAHEPRDFRFMLAWMYQRQPQHGVMPWFRWYRIQKRLKLHLDWNYRLNTTLLAFLPSSLAGKHFDTLIKLKR